MVVFSLSSGLLSGSLFILKQTEDVQHQQGNNQGLLEDTRRQPEDNQKTTTISQKITAATKKRSSCPELHQ